MLKYTEDKVTKKVKERQTRESVGEGVEQKQDAISKKKKLKKKQLCETYRFQLIVSIANS